MNLHTVTIEVVALTDSPDLLHELLRSIVSEGLAQYGEWDELSAFQRLTVHVTSPKGERYKLVEYVERETNEPVKQLAMLEP